MSHLAARVRRALVVAAVLVAVLAPTALALAACPRWWRYIAAEQTPMTWLQSVVLVLAGATALLLALVPALLGHDRAPGRRVWVLLGCGFLLLALDERFAVHERVRDGFLAPRDIRLPLLAWVGPGTSCCSPWRRSAWSCCPGCCPRCEATGLPGCCSPPGWCCRWWPSAWTPSTRPGSRSPWNAGSRPSRSASS